MVGWKFRLLVITGALAVGLLVLLSRANPIPFEPCATDSAPPMPQAEAAQVMRDYLEYDGVSAEVQVREEGSFMLGAYPRSRVLWSIRILRPDFLVDDGRLQAIALAAYCLRRGWVWLNIQTPAGERTLVAFSQNSLEQARLEVTMTPGLDEYSRRSENQNAIWETTCYGRSQ